MFWTVICLLLIWYFFIRPAYKIWRVYNDAKNRAREMQDAFQRAAGIDPDELRRQQEQKEKARRKGGWTTPAPRPKKIDPEVGEYVKFKEVTVAESTVSESTATDDTGKETRRTVVTENQIEDVKWEEL